MGLLYYQQRCLNVVCDQVEGSSGDWMIGIQSVVTRRDFETVPNRVEGQGNAVKGDHFETIHAVCQT